MRLFTEKNVSAIITNETKLLSDSQLRDLQMEIYEIAKDILAFCNRHRLSVQLSGGTALGAVRHQGFIPWDDDMDLNMPRKDYNWFVSHFLDEYGERYYLKAANYDYDDPRDTSVIKVVKKGTIYKRLTSGEDEETGIWVDIWVIENTYNNALLRFLHGIGCYYYTGAVACKGYNDFWKRNCEAYRKSSVFRILQLKKNIGYLYFFTTYNKLKYRQQRWFARCHNDQTEYVVIPSGRGKFFGETYNRKSFLETMKIRFEDRSWPITKDYDRYLSQLYGSDYMTPPPPEKRERHAALELKYNAKE